MKYLIALLLLVLSTPAHSIDACFSGSWYEPFTEGEGINIEISDSVVTGYFYTWRNGSRDMYTLTGYNDQKDFNALTGHASFLWDGLHTTFPVGHAAIEVFNSNIILFAWDWGQDWANGTDPVPQCDRSECYGVRTMVRLTQPIACD